VTVIDESFDLKILRGASSYQQWVLAWFEGALRGQIAEVGPGIGNFTRWLSEAADQVVAIEPEPIMCDEITALGLPNVTVVQGLIEDVAPEIPPSDAVFMCNVLEHIGDDEAAIASAHALLKPGGHICVVVPAHQLLYGTLDRRYGHLRRYRKRDIRRALESAGFVDVKAEYFNPVGALGWFLVVRVLRRPHLSEGSVTLSERVAVPAGKALRRLGRPPFGQSVVAIGRRSPS
jgi:SAM-dependent methyltransferase